MRYFIKLILVPSHTYIHVGKYAYYMRFNWWIKKKLRKFHSHQKGKINNDCAIHCTECVHCAMLKAVIVSQLILFLDLIFCIQRFEKKKKRVCKNDNNILFYCLDFFCHLPFHSIHSILHDNLSKTKTFTAHSVDAHCTIYILKCIFNITVTT